MDVRQLVGHCCNITALRVRGMSDDSLATVAPALSTVQHLVLFRPQRSGHYISAVHLQRLAQHCSQLKTLTFGHCKPNIPEAGIIALIAGLTVRGLLSLWSIPRQDWITDSVLAAVATNGKQLRTLALYCRSEVAVYTVGGLTALLQGCPQRMEMHLLEADQVHTCAKTLRPHTAFSTRLSRSALFWGEPSMD
jgi:hypothetical protein